MSEKKYFCFCSSNCKYETMTKEQILAAIAQAAETGLVIDPDSGFITKIKETNAGGYVSFWVGTQAQYNALKEKDHKHCMYILTDCASAAELTQAVKDLKAHAANKENPHGVTAEQVGAKAIGIEPIETGGTGAHTAPHALANLSDPHWNEDWRIAENGISVWHFEVADTEEMRTQYNIPNGGCEILVIKRSASRGTAIAFGWIGGDYRMWRNVLHDDTHSNKWSSWVDATTAIEATPVSHLSDTNNPHGTTAVQIGALCNNKWASDYATVLEAAMAMPKTGGTFFAGGGSTLINAADSAFPGVEVTYLMLTDETIGAARRTVVAFQYGGRRVKYRTIWDGTWQTEWDYFVSIEDIGAAPAGYGIGGGAKDITGQDLNTITGGGYYYYDTAINSPTELSDWCYLEVIPSNGHSVTQILRRMGTPVGCVVVRHKIDWDANAWSEWEWENPPMALNTEYRTTERDQGKVVYKKSFDLGALPNASTKSVAIDFSPTRILSSEFHYAAGAKLYSHGDLAVSAYVGLYEVEPPIANITTTYDASGTTGCVTVRYTKD